MTDRLDDTHHDDVDSLAGEYVLGTLSTAARQAVASRMESDAVLRRAVADWEARLLPLTALAPPVEPAAALWSRIEKTVGIDSGPAAATTTSSQRGFARWWDNLNLWRTLAGAGFAAAALLAAVLVQRLDASSAPQYVVVLVAPQDKAPGWIVQTASTRQLTLAPLATTVVPEHKSLQFWTKADQWRGPVSLGLVKPGQPLRVRIDQLPPLEANQLFELTLEPENGSPIDRPTGPIQYIGRAVRML